MLFQRSSWSPAAALAFCRLPVAGALQSVPDTLWDAQSEPRVTEGVDRGSEKLKKPHEEHVMRSHAICGLYLVSLLLTIASSRSAIADEGKVLLTCEAKGGDDYAIEIDYEHGLVRHPATGSSNTAEVTDATVNWSETSGPWIIEHSLNRYTGIVTNTTRADPTAECTIGCSSVDTDRCRVSKKIF